MLLKRAPPYTRDARYATKRHIQWNGNKHQVTETDGSSVTVQVGDHGTRQYYGFLAY